MKIQQMSFTDPSSLKVFHQVLSDTLQLTIRKLFHSKFLDPKGSRKRRREQISLGIAPLSSTELDVDEEELLDDGMDEISDNETDDENERPFKTPVLDTAVSEFCLHILSQLAS